MNKMQKKIISAEFILVLYKDWNETFQIHVI